MLHRDAIEWMKTGRFAVKPGEVVDGLIYRENAAPRWIDNPVTVEVDQKTGLPVTRDED